MNPYPRTILFPIGCGSSIGAFGAIGSTRSRSLFYASALFEGCLKGWPLHLPKGPRNKRFIFRFGQVRRGN